MKANTADGFEVEIIEEHLDDWEFLELLDAVDNGEHGKIVRVAKFLLGDDEVKRLKQHIKETDGKVPATKMVQALTEIMESANTLKNS